MIRDAVAVGIDDFERVARVRGEYVEEPVAVGVGGRIGHAVAVRIRVRVVRYHIAVRIAQPFFEICYPVAIGIRTASG